MSTDETAPDTVQRISELINHGELDAAEQALNTAADSELEPVDRALLTGELAAGRGDLHGALRALRRAAAIAPENPEPIVKIVDVLYQLGRVRRARLLLWRKTRKQPEPALWSARADLQLTLGHTKHAAESLERAVALAPDNRDYVVGHAYLLRTLGRYDRARRSLTSAIARMPDDPALLVSRGVLELEDEQVEAAGTSFAKAREKAPADSNTVRLQAVTTSRLGRYAKAQEILERAIAESSDGSEAALLVELGVVRFMRGFPQDAERLLRQALELEPGNESAASNAAALLQRQGRLDEALQCLRDALSEEQGSRALELRAAGIAQELHDYGAAEEHYRNALKLGTDPASRKALRRVRWRSGRRSVVAPLLGAVERETRRRFNDERPVLALLDELVTGEGPLPRSLKARATRLAWRRARLGAVLTRLVPANWALVGFTIGLALLLSPVIVGGGRGDHPTPPDDAAVTVLYFVTLAAFYVVILWTISPARQSSFPVRLMGCAFVPSIIAAVLLQLRGHIPDRLDLPILWTAVAFGAAFLLELVLFLALVGTERFALRRLRRDDPYAAAVTSLVSVLVQLRTGVDPVDRREVRSVVSTLEDAAAGLLDHLRGLEPTGDLRSDAWLSGRATGIAAAVRNLKSWVLSPGPESFDALAIRIEQDVKSVGNGYWRDLEWVDPAVAAARERRLWVITTLRNLVLAALPLIAVLIAESVGILTGTTANQLLLASVTWGVVSLLVTFDPSFGEKLGALKDARAAMKDSGGTSGGAA